MTMKELAGNVVISSRKVHKCSMCLEMIPKGSIYFKYAFSGKGEIETLKLCCICAFLITQTPDGKVKKGGFSERMIPNCLRKKRSEFIKNPGKFIERKENE